MGICVGEVLALIYALQMLICSAVWLAQNLNVFDLQCMNLELKKWGVGADDRLLLHNHLSEKKRRQICLWNHRNWIY